MTDTLAPEARGNLVFSREDGALTGVKKYRKTDSKTGASNLILEGVAVFRSGTFRDSNGFQHVWEVEHMTQMVDNHAALSGRGILAHIPVRADHVGFLDSSLNSVIGYNMNVRTEERTNTVSGELCTYLLVDMEIIDENAIKKIESGLWRNLSSEIGTYITNAEAEYWPVYMGVAFVDFPAVEGLANSFSKKNPNGSGNHAGPAAFSLVNEQEVPDMANKIKNGTVDDEKVKGGEFSAEDIESQAKNLDSTDRVDDEGANDEDEAAVPNGETGAGGDSDDQGDEDSGEKTPGADDGDQGGEVDDEKAGAEHGLSSKQIQFSVNGELTSDFAAVQAHITRLEGQLHQARESSVEAFVKALAEDGKILATQIDSLTGFAKSLDETQYSAWAEQYGQMPSLSIFGDHGAGSNRIETPEDMAKSEAIHNELDIQQEIKAAFTKLNKAVPKNVEAKIENLQSQLAGLESN